MSLSSKHTAVKPREEKLKPLNATSSDNLSRVVYNDLFCEKSNLKLKRTKPVTINIDKAKTKVPLTLKGDKTHQITQLSQAPPSIIHRKRKLEDDSETSKYELKRQFFHRMRDEQQREKKVRFSETAYIIESEPGIQLSIKDLIVGVIKPEVERMKQLERLNKRNSDSGSEGEDTDSIAFMSDEGGSDVGSEDDFMFDFSLLYYVGSDCDPGLQEFLRDETLFLMDNCMRGEDNLFT